MFCYALLGAAAVMALYLLIKNNRENARPSAGNTRNAEEIAPGAAFRVQRSEMDICDNLVYVGLAFMTVGMLFGALWAKEAWGHYWAWDPKETWAAITWFAYLAYIHYRLGYPTKTRNALWMLIVAFILLQMCWWGINYLPAAQGSSVHTYNMG